MGTARPAIAIGAGLAVAAWAFRPIWNIDVFWHIAAGRLVLAGGIPHRDVFSAAAPGAPWTSFQWGYEALAAWIEGAWGLGALRAVHAALLGLAAALWTARAGRRSAWSGLAATALWLLLFEDRIRVRPHLLEPLFFALVLLLLSGGTELRALLAATLAPLWADVHAVSALWWPVLAGCWAIERRRARAFGIWALGLAGIAASPGALGGLAGALRSHSDWPAGFVPELRPTLAWLGEGWWGMAVVAGVAGGILAAVALLRSRAPLGERLAGIACAAASVLLARWAWLAAVPAALWFARNAPRWSPALVAACLLALGLRVGGRWSIGDRLRDLEPGRFPEAACDYLDARGLRLPTDTPGRWGGYVLYRLHPPATVLADGRLVFGPEVAELLRRRAAGDASTFDEAAGRFHTLLLLWPVPAPPLDPSRWRRVYADRVAEAWLARPAWGLLPAQDSSVK